jgi:hypothetical protein
MPERTGVINAVKPRRSLEDPGCLGMLLIAISKAWRQRGGNDGVRRCSMGNGLEPDLPLNQGQAWVPGNPNKNGADSNKSNSAVWAN